MGGYVPIGEELGHSLTISLKKGKKGQIPLKESKRGVLSHLRSHSGIHGGGIGSSVAASPRVAYQHWWKKRGADCNISKSVGNRSQKGKS